ncbi:MAG: zinc-binding dehydrogenase [Terrimicrobiaceae bacterium]
MLTSCLTSFGKPADVLRVRESAPPQPGEGELLVEMVAAPVNPADLNVIEGKFLEGQDLREASERICNAAGPCLALNAVGGASALNLANALADRGTLVTYGAMGRQPLKIPNGLLIFRELEFKGFWLSRWSKRLSPARKKEIWSLLAKLSLEGKLRLPVHRVYPLPQLLAALEEAAREGRSGKVLIDLRA